MYTFKVNEIQYINFDLEDIKSLEFLKTQIGEDDINNIIANKEKFRVKTKEELMQDQINTLANQVLNLLGV